MKRSSFWIVGGIVSLILLGPTTAGHAVKDASAAPSSSMARTRAFGVNDTVAMGTSKEDKLAAPPPAPERNVDAFPGRTYGDLDATGCLGTLDRRAIAYERAGRARGVETPVRLTGALHGILFHANGVAWETSARREVLDCRLVLALDDLAAILARHGVTEVVHYGIYRGDAPLPTTGRPRHHVAGLAIDAAAFVKEDGTRLEVLRDWRGRVGARTCGEGAAPSASTADSLELRSILCDIAGEKTFHQVLTPNHDRKHRDHFHLEVMRHTSWSLLE